MFIRGTKRLVRVTWKTVFDAKSPGRRIWQDLHKDGMLSSNPGTKYSSHTKISYETIKQNAKPLSFLRKGLR